MAFTNPSTGLVYDDLYYGPQWFTADYGDVQAVASALAASSPGVAMQGDAYAEQLAREYIEQGRQALENDPTALANFDAAVATADIATIVEQVNAGDAAILGQPEVHPQSHYDYLRAHPEATVGLSPLQTGGYVPPGYVLDQYGNIQPDPGGIAASIFMPWDDPTTIVGGGGTPIGGGGTPVGGGGGVPGGGGVGGVGATQNVTAQAAGVGIGAIIALGLGALFLIGRR